MPLAKSTNFDEKFVITFDCTELVKFKIIGISNNECESILTNIFYYVQLA